MEILTLKVRIMVLWLISAVIMSASMAIFFLEPGSIEEVMAGRMEGLAISSASLLFMALFWLIPLAMAFITVTLRDSANRWTNVIVGLIFAVFYVFHLLGHILQGSLPIEAAVFCVLTILVPAAIVWYACRWPKPTA
jgi:hypothetical protein